MCIRVAQKLKDSIQETKTWGKYAKLIFLGVTLTDGMLGLDFGDFSSL